MSKEQNDWVTKIVFAIGNKTGTSDERLRFAKNLLNYLSGGVRWAGYLEHNNKHLKKISKYLALVMQNIEALNGALKEGGLTSQNVLSMTSYRSDIKGNSPPVDLEQLLIYFNTMSSVLNKQQTAPAKRGTQTIAQQKIVEIIVNTYYNVFKKMPAHYNGIPTPFDRVCSVVSELLQVYGYANTSGKISDSTKVKAIKKHENRICHLPK